MKKTFLGIIIILILPFFSFAHAKVKPNDISFPKHFYTKQINACTFVGDESFEFSYNKSKIESLINLDWMSEWAKGNSRSVNHENLTGPMTLFAVTTHTAVGNNDKKEINSAKRVLIEMAKANILYDTIGKKELKKKPRCWKDGNPESPCWYHAYEFARDAFTNYMIVASYLKEHLSNDELKLVDKYIKKMHKKFIKPEEFADKEKGFYAMGNGGIPNLVYANWTANKKLAAKELNFRFRYIDKVFYDDGYINNNSFRGYRGLWYHSYGLNSVLGYIYLAELWGAKTPDTVIKKVTKAAEVLNLGITDYEKFSSRKYDGDQLNNQYKKKNARMHTHQDALAIDTLMEMITGIKLKTDPTYLYKRSKKGIDDLIGFNANCINK
tara:strand:- start:344 stop:1489 length:1146 start_codon:yes stop_codon:yes gene_type:complete